MRVEEGRNERAWNLIVASEASLGDWLAGQCGVGAFAWITDESRIWEAPIGSFGTNHRQASRHQKDGKT